ncbi:hypothetical protein ACOSQ4_023809 [Xanthoceras sorbifolium]
MLDVMLPGLGVTFLKQLLIWLAGIVGLDDFVTVKFTNEGIDGEYGLPGMVNIRELLIAIQAAGVEDYIEMLVTTPTFEHNIEHDVLTHFRRFYLLINLRLLRQLRDLIRRTESVWMCPTYENGPHA